MNVKEIKPQIVTMPSTFNIEGLTQEELNFMSYIARYRPEFSVITEPDDDVLERFIEKLSVISDTDWESGKLFR